MTKLWDQWWEFVHNNYWSEVTPSANRTTVTTIFPLELLMNYGIWKVDAYDKYFFNERDQSWYTDKEVKSVRDPKKFPYDLTTIEGKQAFEREINDVNNKYPGIVAAEAQGFDYKKHYAEIGV